MLTPEEIRRALHASRVLDVEVSNPHGPLGLEHLAAGVKQRLAPSSEGRVSRRIDLPVETWERLDRLAAKTSQATSSRVRPGELAAAIIEEYLASTS